MPRRFISVLAPRVASICVALLLTGCVPREDQQIRLRAAFWSVPSIEEEIARRFEAEHPGVKVDLLITGGRFEVGYVRARVGALHTRARPHTP